MRRGGAGPEQADSEVGRGEAAGRSAVRRGGARSEEADSVGRGSVKWAGRGLRLRTQLRRGRGRAGRCLMADPGRLHLVSLLS